MRTDAHARQVAIAHGAPAIVAGRAIHLDLRNVDPDTSLGRTIVAHEVTHLAQQHLGVTAGRRGSMAAAEEEASRVGAALAERTSLPAVRVGLDPDTRPTWRPPGYAGIPPQTEISPDGFVVLPGRALRIEKLWYERNFGTSHRNAEKMDLVLTRLSTELPWIADLTPEQRRDAAGRMTLTAPFAPGEDTAIVHISEEIYAAIGLPPGTDVLWSFPAAIATPASPPAMAGTGPPRRDDGDDPPPRMAHLFVRATRFSPTDQGRGARRMSPALAIEVVESLERATSLAIDPAVRSALIARFVSGVFDPAGALAFNGPAPRWLCVAFFGELNWRAFERRLAGEPASAAGAASGRAGSSVDPSLDPAAQQYALQWIREAFGREASDGGAPLLITATVVETMREIDASPDRERILDRLRHPGPPSQQPSSIAEQLRGALNATRLAAEYARLGVEPSGEARPIFNRPVDGEIVNHSDLLFIGKKAEFSFRTSSHDGALAVPWVDVTWIIRDTAARETSAPTLERGHTSHRELPGETPARFDITFDRRGTYEVNALVAHRFYLPRSFTIFVEVKTEDERLAELAHGAFDQPGGMFADVIQTEAHAFGDANFTDTHDRGQILFGRLATQSRPGDRPLASPTAPIDDRIRQINQYIESGSATASQLSAARDYLHELEAQRDRLRDDQRLGARVIYIQGAYLSRTARARSQELQLVANVRRHDQNWELIVYDVTRAFDNRDSRFPGRGATYQAAAEQCFVTMCKAYPTGRMIVRLETLNDELTTTGNFVGFELDCTSTWEEIRSVVWNPTVQLVVNIAGTIVMIFLPVTAPILIPALIAYNGIETIANLADYYERDAVHKMDVVMALGQLAMDLIPYVGRVGRLVKVGGRSYHVMERVLIAGDVALIGAQAIEEVQELRFGVLREAADVNAQIEERQRNNPSDPELPALRERFAELQARSQDAWAQVAAGIVKNQLIMRVPSHAATHLAAIHEGRVQEARGVLDEALRSRAGERVRDADMLHLERVMGVDVESIPNSGDVKIAYDVGAFGGITNLRVQVGDRASLGVVMLHDATLAAMRRYAGLTGSLRALLARVDAYRRGGGHIPVGSHAFEAHFELLKLPPMIERFHVELAGVALNDAVRGRIEAQIASLEAQLEHHARRLDDVAEGLGYVAALERPPEAGPSGRPSAEEQPASRPPPAHPATGEQVHGRGDRLPPPPEGAADPGYRELLRLRGHDRATLRPRPQGWTGRQEARFRWGTAADAPGAPPEGYHWSISPDGEPNLVRDRLYDERGNLVPPRRFDPTAAEGQRFPIASDNVERARLSEGERFEPSAQTASEQHQVLAHREEQRIRRDAADAEVERLRERLGVTDEQLSSGNFDETIARLRREHAGNADTLRLIDGLVDQRRTLGQARHQVSQASMQIGQLMAHDWVMQNYPSAELIHGGVGSVGRSGDFDAVYLVSRGEGQRPLILIIEAKGGSSTLGTRRVGVQTTQQGTQTYMREIARLMAADEHLPPRTREAMHHVLFGLADVRYVLVEAPIGTQAGLPTLQLGRARDFDVTASP